MASANSINESTSGITGFTGTAFTGTAVTQYNVITGGATSSTLSPSVASEGDVLMGWLFAMYYIPNIVYLMKYVTYLFNKH